MVCAKCEAKLPKLAVADKWKAGAGGAPASAAAVRAPGAPPPVARPCRACKSNVHLVGAYYCQACSYKNGICAMCGTRVLDVSSYKMSSR